MKKILALLLALVLVFSFAACSSTTEDEDEDEDTTSTDETEEDTTEASDLKIAILVINMGIDYYRQVCYGAVQACEAEGIEFVIKSGIEDVATQLQAVEDLIEAGCDGIILSPLDSYGLATAVDLCIERGVTLISQADIYGADQNADSVMETDNVWMGELIAEYVVEQLDGAGNVLILKNAAGVANSEEKVEGMENIFDQYDDIVVLDVLEDASDLDSAQTKTADACQAYGYDIDAVVGINELSVLGAINAMEEYGYSIGEDVVFFSCNYATELDEYIESGVCLTGIYSWGNLFGQWAVEMIVRDQTGLAIPDNVNLPATLVTIDNLDVFSAQSTIAHDYDFDSYVES